MTSPSPNLASFSTLPTTLRFKFVLFPEAPDLRLLLDVGAIAAISGLCGRNERLRFSVARQSRVRTSVQVLLPQNLTGTRSAKVSGKAISKVFNEWMPGGYFDQSEEVAH